MSSLKVCDYVTIHAKGTLTTANPQQIYEFDIPNTYYSNQRSQVCTVEVSNGIVLTTQGSATTLIKSVAVVYLNGGVNHYVSNNLRPIIGHAQAPVANTLKIYPTGALLCNARPQKVAIQFLELKYNAKGQLTPPPLTTASLFNFMITLKYSYYDSIETARELQREKTPHMR